MIDSKKIYSFHSIFIQVIGFVCNIILVEKVAPEEYAHFIICMAAAAIIHNLSTLGLSVRFKFLVLNQINTIRLIQINLILTLLIFVIGLNVEKIFAIIFINISLMFFQGLIAQLCILQNRLITATFIPILSQLASLVSIFLSSSIFEYMIYFITINSVLLIIQFLMSKELITGNIFGVNKNSNLIDFKAYLSSMIDILHSRIDIIILNIFLDADDLGKYNLAKLIMHSIVNIFLNYTRGHTYEIGKRNKVYQTGLKIISYYTTMSFLILTIILLTPWIFSLLQSFRGLNETIIASVLIEYGLNCLVAALFLACARSILFYFTLVGDFLNYLKVLFLNLIFFVLVLVIYAYFSVNLGLLLILLGAFELSITMVLARHYFKTLEKGVENDEGA